MAAGIRSIKIKFVGDARDLDRAAGKAVNAVQKVGLAVAAAGAGIGSKVTGALSDAVEAMPPMGKLVAGVLSAGLAVSLAPAVGAAVSAAVLLGVGGGALALGIKSAADSPAVKTAFAGLKKQASSTFEDFGKPFERPLARLVTSFQGTLTKLEPAILRIGAVIAPVLDKLGPALDGFATRAMPGIEKAVTASVPLFNTLAEKLPGIGEAVGDFFGTIAENGDDANLFFGDMIDLITGTITALGTVIGWLAQFYSAVRNQLTAAGVAWVQFKIGAITQLGQILDAAYDSLSWVPGLDSKLKTARDKFAQFRRDANAELAMIKSRYEIAITARLTTLGFKTNSPGQFTGRASGGPVQAGRTYRVGENGPEVVTFGASGFVTPNRELTADPDAPAAQLHIHLADEVTKVITLTNRDLKRRARSRSAYLA